MFPETQLKLEPLGDFVIVFPKPREDSTKGGLYIPEAPHGERPQQGTVIALGTGGITNDQGKECADPRKYLQVGDSILFSRYSGDDLKIKTKTGEEVEIKVLRLSSVLTKVIPSP